MLDKGLQAPPIAIIGVAGIFAGAQNAQEYWDNILNKIDSLTEVPASRWNPEDYYDPDPSAPDKTYCKRGGFIPDIDFNPMEFGLPPNILEVTDVSQLLGLVVARDVLTDAGYGAGREFDRERTGVVLGVAGSQKLVSSLASRLQYPVWKRVLLSSGLSETDTDAIIEKIKLAYVPWEENSFPGLLGNVIAGRIANRFDLGGLNAVVDAACASSLAAVQMAVDQLGQGRCDMMITGGVDTDNSIMTYMCFSKTPAFSKNQASRPFDAAADGMMAGEGLGMLVLKRLADAERDGDRIYATLRGIGASSDGRFKSIYAPRPEGQSRALRRAYAAAGFEPATVGLIEAHGTGTPAGDAAEIAGLRAVFNHSNQRQQHIALGSVKSQIGHTKGAAGAAGLIKTALALHHKVLPPTLNVTTPNPKMDLEHSPFYVNSEARPWIRAEGAPPRRAGVSAFGFGGTNFHVVLEEYTLEQTAAYRLQKVAQPVLLHAPTTAQLLKASEATLTAITGSQAESAYADLTRTSRSISIPAAAARLGFVADSREEAVQLLQTAIAVLKKQPQAATWEHPRGIYFRQTGLAAKGNLVALFPGQGSQYLNMGREIALNFPPLRQTYAQMDARFSQDGLKPLSEVVFPIPAFDEPGVAAQEEALRATDYAQAAIGVTSAGLFRLLERAGFQPDFTAGHSFGELSALWAAGVLTDTDFFTLVKARGRAMAPPADPSFDAGSMLAVQGDLADIEREVAALPDIIIANQNSTKQVALAGPTAAIRQAQTVLEGRGFKATLLNVSAAFHTPLVSHASAPFAAAVQPVTFHPGRLPVYSNTTGEPYPAEAEAAKAVLANHILHPVIFKTQIERIYAAGGRVFVEVGPRRILTNLVIDILAGRPHVAVALNSSREKSSDRQLRDAAVQLKVAGVPLADIDPYALDNLTATPAPAVAGALASRERAAVAA
jgi:polyketide-type polyunsaturated fatty acid synthase PfaA